MADVFLIVGQKGCRSGLSRRTPLMTAHYLGGQGGLVGGFEDSHFVFIYLSGLDDIAIDPSV